MDLRGYEFYKVSGLPVSGVTVDAWDAVDGTPGGSPIASTTTSATGKWEFLGLTNTPKDIRVTFTGSVRWYKGLVKTDVTNLLVGVGGITSLGSVGIGVAPLGNAGLTVNGSYTAATGAAYGTYQNPTLTAAANGDVLLALYLQPTYADAGHTGVVHAGFSLPPVANNIGGGLNSATGLQIQFGSGTGNKILDLLDQAGGERFYVNSGGGIGMPNLSSLSLGTGSGAGLVRIPNNNSINWRNAANTQDHAILFNGSDQFIIQPNLSTALTVSGSGSTSTIVLGSGSGAGNVRLQNSMGINWRNGGNTNDNSIYWDSNDSFVIQRNLGTIAWFTNTGSLNLGTGGWAGGGLLRLQNLGGAGGVYIRNAANNGDNGFYFDGSDIFVLNGAVKDNAASAGGVNSTPATTAGYLPIFYNGSRYKIPLYV